MCIEMVNVCKLMYAKGFEQLIKVNASVMEGQ